MQRRIEAHKGIVVIVRGGIGKFEDMAGETYTIELVNGTWTVTRDVWDEDANDWTSESVGMSWATFARHHSITRLVE